MGPAVVIHLRWARHREGSDTGNLRGNHVHDHAARVDRQSPGITEADPVHRHPSLGDRAATGDHRDLVAALLVGVDESGSADRLLQGTTDRGVELGQARDRTYTGTRRLEGAPGRSVRRRREGPGCRAGGRRRRSAQPLTGRLRRRTRPGARHHAGPAARADGHAGRARGACPQSGRAVSPLGRASQPPKKTRS